MGSDEGEVAESGGETKGVTMVAAIAAAAAAPVALTSTVFAEEPIVSVAIELT